MSDKFFVNDKTIIIIQTSKKTNIGKFVAIFPLEKSKTFVKKFGKKFIVNAVPIITIIGKIYLEFTYGILNLPLVSRSANSASLCGESIKTPPQTNTKANKVPMDVKSNTKFSSVKNIGIPTTKPVTIVAKLGVLYFG